MEKLLQQAMQILTDAASMQQPQHKTFEGKCLVIVRPKDNAGKIILKAEGKNLESGEAVIETK